MNRKLFALCLAAALLPACGPAPTAPSAETTPPTAVAESAQLNSAFADLSKRWIDGAFALNPVSATQNGEHRFDSELDDLSATGRAKSLDFSKSMLKELEMLDRAQLSRDNQIDAAMLLQQLRYDVWTAEQLQSWAWDAQIYSRIAGGAIYTLMAREFAPATERVKSATARIEKLPELFRQTRANLDPARVPRVHAETVAKQHKGVLSLVDDLVLPAAKDLPQSDRDRLDVAVKVLRAAVDEHQKWLDETLVPNAKGEFRLGQKLYDEKLAFALNSPLSRGEIRKRAEAEIARVRTEMYLLAKARIKDEKGAPEAPDQPSHEQQQAVIQAALELAYADRPKREEVVAVATAATDAATQFVKERALVTLPESPVKIILMPEFQRGFSVAYCDAPGPLDKNLETFYAVSPIPDEWTSEQVDSFLREYNTRSIHELSIHEAMPGHFLQLAHANKQGSLVRALLGSDPFIEGWAMYAEKIVADEGYMNGDPLFQLIHRKWYLRAIANAILDQAIHVDGMSRESAMELMTKTTFQEEREAAGKWTRAQLSAAQLPTYFVGFQEHMDLRRAVQERDGIAFKATAFHDAVLSHGSPPVRYVRQMMFAEPIK